MLNYYNWLAGLAALFVVLERLWPRLAGQPLFRRGWLSDMAYIVFNSKYLGVLLGYLTALWIGRLDAAFARAWARELPWWVQFAVLLVAIDFVKWCTHHGNSRAQARAKAASSRPIHSAVR